MSTEQEQWAVQIREIPVVFRKVLLNDGNAIRHRPAAGEWSAIEVVGHMIDKMQIWISRVERIMVEERPALPAYDQDAHGASCAVTHRPDIRVEPLALIIHFYRYRMSGGQRACPER